jgi:hypothetical protein
MIVGFHLLPLVLVFLVSSITSIKVAGFLSSGFLSSGFLSSGFLSSGFLSSGFLSSLGLDGGKYGQLGGDGGELPSLAFSVSIKAINLLCSALISLGVVFPLISDSQLLVKSVFLSLPLILPSSEPALSFQWLLMV